MFLTVLLRFGKNIHKPLQTGKMINTPRKLAQRELDLIQKLANCQLAMTPREFEAKWDVTRAQMAALCNCSLGSVKRWFKSGRDYTAPNQYHLRYLAITDLILEYVDEIPPELLRSILKSQGAANNLKI